MRTRALLLLVTGWGLVLAGCVDQAKETATYRRVLEGQTPPATQPYTSAQPLSLTRAMNLAIAHDERLSIAGEAYLQALINKDRAAAAFLPTIGIVPTWVRQKETAYATGNPLIAEFVPKSAVDIPVSGTLRVSPVRDWSQIQASKLTARQQRDLLLDLKQSVLLDVAQTWYGVVEAQKRVQVLNHSLAVQQQRVRDIQAKVSAGMVRRLDLAQSQAQASDTRVQLLKAQNDVRTGRQMLAFLVGVPAVDGPLQDDLAEPAPQHDAAAWLRRALDHRPDLQAAQVGTQAAAKQLQAAWGEYFPSVTLNLTGYLQRQSFPDDVGWTSMVQAYIPLFSAGLVYADVRDAYSQLRQARLAQQRLQRRVHKDIEVALADLDSNLAQVAELRVQVAAAQQAVRDAEAGFAAGTATNLERLTAQDRLLAAELQLTTGQIGSKVDYLMLLRLTGQLAQGAWSAAPTTQPARTAALPDSEHGS